MPTGGDDQGAVGNCRRVDQDVVEVVMHSGEGIREVFGPWWVGAFERAVQQAQRAVWDDEAAAASHVDPDRSIIDGHSEFTWSRAHRLGPSLKVARSSCLRVHNPTGSSPPASE